MNDEQMRNGIKALEELFNIISNKYGDWFKDGEGNCLDYSNVLEKNEIEELENKATAAKKNFLVPLANDCYLTTEEINGRQYGLTKMENGREPGPQIKNYMWSKLIRDGSLVVANSVSYESAKDNKFAFYISVDIEKNNGDREKNSEYNESFVELKKNINILQEDNNPFENIIFDENNRPKIEIELSESKDYYMLLQEYINDVFKMKVLFKYVNKTNTDEQEKKREWEKVVHLFKALKLTEESGMILSPTIFTLEDLLFDDNKQIVLTGAPGTGKTYSAQEYVMWQAMTDYIEANDSDNNCIALNYFIDYWKDKREETKEVEDENVNRRIKEFINDYKDKRFHMVQFHPSYDYTDFVEGLRPEYDRKGGMKFTKKDGEFKAFCREAAKKSMSGKKCYFIIDEINRADLSKVFGELMFCLEEDYRGPGHTIKTQYSNLVEKGTEFADGFYIPENVIIIGTMNDIDRSVDTFDFALRRRFRWIKVGVDKALLNTTFHAMNKNYDANLIPLKIDGYVDNIIKMNEVFNNPDYKRIFRTPEDYYIGPAYFKGLFKGDSMNSIWKNKVEPLLGEYVRGRDDAGDFIKACRDILLSKGSSKTDDLSEEELMEGFSKVENEEDRKKIVEDINKVAVYLAKLGNGKIKGITEKMPPRKYLLNLLKEVKSLEEFKTELVKKISFAKKVPSDEQSNIQNDIKDILNGEQ